MPQKVERYLTKDGELFEHLEDAIQHESQKPILRELSNFVDEASQEYEEYLEPDSVAKVILFNYEKICEIIEGPGSAKLLRRKLRCIT